MATTKKNTKSAANGKPMPMEKEPPVSVKKVVHDERTHKITGFFLILIAISLCIAFVSYAFTWQQDQDKVFNTGKDFWFADDLKVENKLGRLGAWVSHLFIYKGFGIASYFLCMLPFVVGINLIFRKKIFSIWRNVFFSLTGLFYFSVALSFITKGSAFSYGGGLGDFMSESLTNLLGMAGTALFLIVAGLGWFIWRFNPVFKVPKTPKIPEVKFPFSKKETVPEEDNGAILMIDDSLSQHGMAVSEKKEALLSTVVTADTVKQTPLSPTSPPPQEIQAGSTTGLSINDLYMLGKETELAKRRFQPEADPVNPLEQQSVKSGGNTIDGDDYPLSVMVTNEEKNATIDPINALSVSEKPGRSEKGNPVLLIHPTGTEPSGVTIVPPADETHFSPESSGEVQTDEPGELDNEVPGKYASDSGVVVQSPVPSQVESIGYPNASASKIKIDSDLELEIKPSAEEIKDKEEQREMPVKTPAQKVQDLPPYDPMLDLIGYQYPSLDLLDTHGSEKIVTDPTELETHKNQILNTLKNYDISIQRISATVGPTVTLYEIVPAPGVRISRIKNLEDDIALSLAALGIRIIAPIPGKGTIGIEVPNVRKTVVSMRTLLASEKFQHSTFSLPIAIGKKIDNEHFVVDLASMPHLLMAGATGQGKSVGINAVLVSLLYKKHPSQLKLVLVDPKKVELSLYRAIEKHFLAKLPGEEESIITDTKKVVHTLNALCIEMDNRYDLLKEAGVRNIKEYNEKFIKRRLSPEKGHQFLPFIVLVIDEFADLIMTAGKEIEMPIARLAQLARAVGIHLIIATQRPSVNIITGTIKANFPSRVAFKVSSKIDSRTILDAGGAEQLIGKGDLLISHNGELIRLQCAFVDTPEVERICEAIGQQRGYPEAFLLPEYVDEKEMEARDFDVNDRDNLFDDAARLIVHHQQGSTSLIQRRMKLGYNRAGRLMDQLEQAGIVGPNQGSKPRDVLVKTDMDLQEILGRF